VKPNGPNGPQEGGHATHRETHNEKGCQKEITYTVRANIASKKIEKLETLKKIRGNHRLYHPGNLIVSPHVFVLGHYQSIITDGRRNSTTINMGIHGANDLQHPWVKNCHNERRQFMKDHPT
jgi:hypothetical protein